MMKKLRRIVIVVLCCMMVYVLTFVVLTRLSLRVQTACSVALEEYVEAEQYYYVPYNTLEIAASADGRLENLHHLLRFIFFPLEILDNRLTGCYSWKSTPTIGWHEVPLDAVKEHPFKKMHVEYP